MFNGKKNELVTTEAGKGKMLTMPFFFFSQHIHWKTFHLQNPYMNMPGVTRQ